MLKSHLAQLSFLAILSGCQAGLWPRATELTAPTQNAVANNLTPFQNWNWSCIEVRNNFRPTSDPSSLVVIKQNVEVVIPQNNSESDTFDWVALKKMFSNDIEFGMKPVCWNNNPK